MSLYIVIYFFSVSINLCICCCSFFGGKGLGVFADLSVVIDFSLEGYKFITIRHYYVLSSLNKDSTSTTAAAAAVASTPTTT